MPTVEFGAIVWLAAPDQAISVAGIPSPQAVGSGVVARAITAAGISSAECAGNAAAIPGPVTVTVRSIASRETFGVVVIEVIVEGAHLSLIATHLKYKVSARYQKRYVGHTSKKISASYQKRYTSYVLEHEMLAAAANFAEV